MRVDAGRILRVAGRGYTGSECWPKDPARAPGSGDALNRDLEWGSYRSPRLAPGKPGNVSPGLLPSETEATPTSSLAGNSQPSFPRQWCVFSWWRRFSNRLNEAANVLMNFGLTSLAISFVSRSIVSTFLSFRFFLFFKAESSSQN